MRHSEFFYLPPKQITEDLVEFRGSELKHLVVVSRKKSSDVVTVVDGLGNAYTVVLIEVSKKSATCRIQKRIRYAGEPNFKLTLAQAIPKGNRFDWIVEKGTELGVSRFIPIITERAISKSGEERLNRWQKITIAAMKQCGRSVLPEIAPIHTLNQLLETGEMFDFQLMAHPEGSVNHLSTIIMKKKASLAQMAKIKRGLILIGPEGGFTEEEVKSAKNRNFETFSLGVRRLRTETAGIVSVAILIELMDSAL